MLHEPVLVGVDLGTSSLKVVLLDEAGRVVGAATAAYPLHAPAPGVAEQDPQAWWQALRAALAGALHAAGSQGAALRAIGLSGQMHGIVALDAAHAPLRPALIWADQRGAAEVAAIEAHIDQATLLAHTGSRASVSFSAPKIMWLRRNEPEIFARTAHILMPKDYLRLRLTGTLATEPTDASATLLFDLARRDWSDRLLDTFGLRHALFAPVVPTLAVVGALTPHVADDLGLPRTVVVVAGAGDTPAQAVAYGGLEPGVTLATISSGGQLFAALDQPTVDPLGRIHTLCHVTPDRWYALGALQAAGLALRWFHEQCARDLPPGGYDALIAEAANVPAGAHGAIFLPYLLGERTPHMDNDARAVLFGLTLRHDRAAMARAVLEGVAFAFRDALATFQELGVRADEVRLGGGGSRSALWRSIFADVLGLPITRTDAPHGAAQGAALLAGVAVGQFRDLAEASATAVRLLDTVQPTPAHVRRYDEGYALYRALYQALRPAFHSAARL